MFLEKITSIHNLDKKHIYNNKNALNLERTKKIYVGVSDIRDLLVKTLIYLMSDTLCSKI